jgi:transposase
MDTREKLIKARLGLLALAEQLQNVRQACKAAGISRSHYYEIKQAYAKYGSEGLAPQPRRRPRMPNQTPPELERQILQMTTQFPTYSYVRIAGQLRLTGVGVSAAAVRAVWQRHGLTLRIQRLLWLEQKTAAAGGVLSEAMIRLLRKHRGRTVDPEQHVEAPYPGYLLRRCIITCCRSTKSTASRSSICSRTTAENFAGGNCAIPSNCTWPSARCGTDARRSARRRPTVSASVSIAP